MSLKYFTYKAGEAIIVGLSTDVKPALPPTGFVFIEEDTNKIYTVKDGLWAESINLVEKINEATNLIHTQKIMAQIVLNQLT